MTAQNPPTRRLRPLVLALVVVGLSLGSCDSTATVSGQGALMAFEYDDAGHIVAAADARGARLGYRRDAAGRLTGISASSGEELAIAYGEAGEVTSVSTGGEEVHLERDARGRVVAARHGDDAPVRYGFDSRDRVVELTRPDGSRTLYQRGPGGRLLQVQDSQAGVVHFEHAERGWTRRLPSGVVTRADFDEEGRLTSLDHHDAGGDLLAAFRYGWDEAGRRAWAEEQVGQAAPTRTAFRYDQAGRLITAEAGGATHEISWDEGGNRRTGPDGRAFTYDALARLVAVQGPAGDLSLIWDEAGFLRERRSEAGREVLTWDAFGRLERVEGPRGAVSYGYDGLGRLVSRETGGQRVRFVRGAPFEQRIIAEVDGHGRALCRYLDAQGTIARVDAGGAVRFYLEDGLSSVRVVTDDRGAVLSRYDYTLDGRPLSAHPPEDRHLFEGMPWDPAVGLYLLPGRPYDPETARFVARDPEPPDPGRPDTWNPYTWAAGDPVNKSDPAGASPEDWRGYGHDPYGDGWRPYRPCTTGNEPGCGGTPSARSQETAADLIHTAEGIKTQNAALDKLFEVANYTTLSDQDLARKALKENAVKPFMERFAFGPVGDRVHLGWTSGLVTGLMVDGRITDDTLRGSIESGFWDAARVISKGNPELMVAVEASYVAVQMVRKLTEEPVPTFRSGAADSYRDLAAALAYDEHHLPSRERYEAARDGLLRSLADNVETTYVRNLNGLLGSDPDPWANEGWTPYRSGSSTDGRASQGLGGAAPATGSSARVGGVYLDQAAQVLGDLGAISSAVFDPQTGRLVLVGDGDTALPSFSPDLMGVALRSAFSDSGEHPGVSIDPIPEDPRGPTMAVRYLGGVERTRFGHILFESDRLLKAYSLGEDNLTHAPRTSAVPDYYDMLDLGLAFPAEERDDLWSRFWIVPDSVVLRVSEDLGAITVAEARMRVKTETMRMQGGRLVPAGGLKDAKAERFAAHFTVYYDDFAKESPVFAELERIAIASAVARWVREAGLPVELDGLTAAITPYDTAAQTPSLEVSRQARGAGADGRGEVIHTVRVYGGVDLQVTPGYLPKDPEAEAEARRVAASRPPEPLPTWSLEDGRRAVALPGPDTREVAPLVRVHADCMCGPDTIFSRVISSFDDREGPFGHGWSLGLPTLSSQATGVPGERRTLRAAEGLPAVEERAWYLDPGPTGDRLRFDRITQEPGTGLLGFAPAEPGRWRMLIPAADNGAVLLGRDGDRMVFDPAGRLVSMSLPGRGSLEVLRDSAGRPLELVRDGRHRVVLSWGDAGWITAATCDGAPLRYSYSPEGDLTRVEGAPGGTLEYGWDPRHRLTEVRRAGAVVASYGYDEFGRLTWAVEDRRRELQVSPTAAGGREVSFGAGSPERLVYDASLRLTEATDDAGRRWMVTRDAAGRSLREEGPTGRLERERAASGAVVAQTWTDATGRTWRAETPEGVASLALTDPGGVRWEQHFDAAGRPGVLVMDGAPVLRTVWDQHDALVAVETPDAQVLRTSSGGAQHLALHTRGGSAALDLRPTGGDSWELSDGQSSLRLAERGPGTWDVAGDGLPDLQTSVEGDPWGAGGILRLQTGGASTEVRMAAGRPLSSSGPGRTLAWDWDDRGALAGLSVEGGGAMRVTRDPQARTVELHPTGLPTLRWTYDAAGRVVKVEQLPGAGS
ncbi:MAG: RHS repeat-associated core domain-containing protein [Pseudomonadota bacterium]